MIGGASVGATHGEPLTGGAGANSGDEAKGYQHKKSTSIDNGRRRVRHVCSYCFTTRGLLEGGRGIQGEDGQEDEEGEEVERGEA